MDLKEALVVATQVEAADDEVTFEKYSRDTSIFYRKPKLVVFPKNADGIWMSDLQMKGTFRVIICP